MDAKRCKTCQKLLERPKKYSNKQWESKIFCSYKCSGDNISKTKKGLKMSESTKLAISKANKGRAPYKMTDEIRENIKKGFTPELRKKISEKQKGEKNPLWKGGITPINLKIRMTIEYRLWREAVFARDNYTCQECGIRGGDLQAHHIKSFALFPELRFAIDNGITLCVDCHKKTDSYLKNNKKIKC